MPDSKPDWLRERGLYLMDKTPSRRAEIAALPRTCRRRRTDLLHATLIDFGDLADHSDVFLHELLKRMNLFKADAFHLNFDCIEEEPCVALRFSKAQRGVRNFRKHVADHLIAHDFPFFFIPGDAHVTIRYGKDGKGDEPIAPIGWRVDEVVLIESLGGKSTHIEHGCWRLDPLLI